MTLYRNSDGNLTKVAASLVFAVKLNREMLLRISQQECDTLMEVVFKEEGAYPDT